MSLKKKKAAPIKADECPLRHLTSHEAGYSEEFITPDAFEHPGQAFSRLSDHLDSEAAPGEPEGSPPIKGTPGTPTSLTPLSIYQQFLFVLHPLVGRSLMRTVFLMFLQCWQMDKGVKDVGVPGVPLIGGDPSGSPGAASESR